MLDGEIRKLTSQAERFPARDLTEDVEYLRNPVHHGRDRLAVCPSDLDAGPSIEQPTPPVRDASERPKRIAVLGDSISHGVRSAGCARTEHSWPNPLAATLGQTSAGR